MASNRALTTTYAYDALNRLTSAHEEGVGINTTRIYQENGRTAWLTDPQGRGADLCHALQSKQILNRFKQIESEDSIMSLPTNGWKNKVGTSGRSCKCGSWRQHWVNGSEKEWPVFCCVFGCMGLAEVGAHIYNISGNVHGEYIVPACKRCNTRTDVFSLDGGTTLVSANKQKTCEQ